MTVALTIPAQYRKPLHGNPNLGLIEPKPRLRLVRGWWRCGMPDEDVSLYWAWAQSAKAAYENWKHSERAFV